MKRILALGLTVIMCLVMLSGCGIFPTAKLTAEEEHAVEAVKTLKSYLKNPDSLQVHEIKYTIDTKIDKEGSIYIMIDYSAQNGYGGMNRKRVGVSGGMVFESGYEADVSEGIEVALVKSFCSKLLEESWDTAQIVDKNKILNQIKD